MNPLRSLATQPIATLVEVSAILASILMLASCAGYVPGAKSHWDSKVREMCKKDGGVTIYQQVHVSKDEISRHVLPTSAGRLSVTTKRLAHPDAPVYAIDKIATIREGNPIVRRIETDIVRRRDGAVVAKLVRYARLGGDFPLGITEGTSFVCPDPHVLDAELSDRLFIVEGGQR